MPPSANAIRSPRGTLYLYYRRHLADLLLKDRQNVGVRIVPPGHPANFFEPQNFRKDGMARPQGEGMLPHSESENAASTFLLKRWGVFALVNRG